MIRSVEPSEELGAMGFYLRKALTAGPVRFNLSRGGVGVSLGVRGLRVGTGPRGAYVHGGRGGVYFRQGLKTSDTGVATPPDDEAAATMAALPSPPHRGQGGGWTLLVLGAVVGLIGIQASQVPLGVAGALVLTGGIGLMVMTRRWNAAVDRYGDLAQALGEEEAPDRLDELHELQRRYQFRDPYFDRVHELVYKSVLVEALTAMVERQERSTWPARVGHTLGVPDEQRTAIAVETFRELFWFLAADHDLSPAEESALAAAREVFRLPEQAVQAELALIDEFRRARALLEGPLPVVEADIGLQRAEVCHHQTTGALVEERVIRTQQIAGERVKETAWRPVREGRLYVTSKRILVVGDGTISIPFDKILDIEVDVDDRRIAITKDGRQTPYYLTAVDPIFTGAAIERRHRQREDVEPAGRDSQTDAPTRRAPASTRWTLAAVAGESHRNRDGTDRQAIIRDRARKGDPVQLVPEPDNPVDRLAVKVCLTNGEQIGYLPRHVAEEVSQGLEHGEHYGAVIHEITGGVPGKPTRGVVLDLLATSGMTAEDVERLIRDRPARRL